MTPALPHHFRARASFLRPFAVDQYDVMNALGSMLFMGDKISEYKRRGTTDSPPLRTCHPHVAPCPPVLRSAVAGNPAGVQAHSTTAMRNAGKFLDADGLVAFNTKLMTVVAQGAGEYRLALALRYDRACT